MSTIRNNVNLVGRIANNLSFQLKQVQTANGLKTLKTVSFGLFVDRQNQKDKSDYVPVKMNFWSDANGQFKDSVLSYVGKGDLIAVAGHIETWFSQVQNQQSQFGMQIIVDSLDIGLESKAVRQARRGVPQTTTATTAQTQTAEIPAPAPAPEYAVEQAFEEGFAEAFTDDNLPL